jgi:hypothetical protein
VFSYLWTLGAEDKNRVMKIEGGITKEVEEKGKGEEGKTKRTLHACMEMS